MTTLAGEHATDAEIAEAIKHLSDADATRLERVAALRARMLSGLGLGLDAADLLQEAIMRTVAGRRRWRKKVPFVKHLIESMRSIADHARDKLKGGIVVPATTEDSDGSLYGVDVRAEMINSETLAAAHQQFEVIAATFADDDEVGLVIEGLAQGSTGPEIRSDLGITEQQFETIMLRLRRGIDRTTGWRP